MEPEHISPFDLHSFIQYKWRTYLSLSTKMAAYKSKEHMNEQCKCTSTRHRSLRTKIPLRSVWAKNLVEGRQFTHTRTNQGKMPPKTLVFCLWYQRKPMDPTTRCTKTVVPSLLLCLFFFNEKGGGGGLLAI